MDIAQLGGASVCGTEGCRFKSHYPPFMGNNVELLQFNRIKVEKKSFTKKNFLIYNLNYSYNWLNNSKKYPKYIAQFLKYLYKYNTNATILRKTTITGICISQKKFNPKCVFRQNTKTLNSFSVGSVAKYFKIKQGKYIRRSTKGLKIFLNFLKSVFKKKYLNKKTTHIFVNILGVDYNLVYLRRGLKRLVDVEHNKLIIYTIYNLKVSFTKLKDKKIKAIKKRLRKKIALNFLKKVNNF